VLSVHELNKKAVEYKALHAFGMYQNLLKSIIFSDKNPVAGILPLL